MARITVQAINTELAKRGIRAVLYKERGYFMFRGPDTADWLNRTVLVEKVTELSMDQWLAAYQDLKKNNAAISKAAKPGRKKKAIG